MFGKNLNSSNNFFAFKCDDFNLFICGFLLSLLYFSCQKNANDKTQTKYIYIKTKFKPLQTIIKINKYPLLKIQIKNKTKNINHHKTTQLTIQKDHCQRGKL